MVTTLREKVSAFLSQEPVRFALIGLTTLLVTFVYLVYNQRVEPHPIADEIVREGVVEVAAGAPAVLPVVTASGTDVETSADGGAGPVTVPVE
ncbi:MAG: hypothetical protein WDK95_15405 [Syntrophorhabdaceae bacterium]|jgi:hypothetical protein